MIVYISSRWRELERGYSLPLFCTLLFINLWFCHGAFWLLRGCLPWLIHLCYLRTEYHFICQYQCSVLFLSWVGCFLSEELTAKSDSTFRFSLSCHGTFWRIADEWRWWALGKRWSSCVINLHFHSLLIGHFILWCLCLTLHEDSLPEWRQFWLQKSYPRCFLWAQILTAVQVETVIVRVGNRPIIPFSQWLRLLGTIYAHSLYYGHIWNYKVVLSFQFFCRLTVALWKLLTW